MNRPPGGQAAKPPAALEPPASAPSPKPRDPKTAKRAHRSAFRRTPGNRPRTPKIRRALPAKASQGGNRTTMAWTKDERKFLRLTETRRQRNQERRNRFLKPPPSLSADTGQGDAAGLLKTAVRLVEKAKEETFTPASLHARLRQEANASSAIEGEFGQEAISRNHAAIRHLLARKPGKRSMLQCHAALMEERTQAQPGQYRTVEVQVGHHRPPPHPQVPALMKELFHYVNNSQDPLPLKAAWAHVQFETIHPFADGNGRAGRALITQMAQLPLPMSVEILKQRTIYYRMLDHGNWQKYLEWFLECFIAACKELIGKYETASKPAEAPKDTNSDRNGRR